MTRADPNAPACIHSEKTRLIDLYASGIIPEPAYVSQN
jgi:hypothetical protein